MRKTTGMTLFLALLAAGCAGGSGDEVQDSMDASSLASAEAVEIIDDVVEDPHRAAMAKRSAMKTHETIRLFYENVVKQRNELIHIMGRRGVTREDCQPVLTNLAKLREQFREQTINSWLGVRASMTTDEWLAFNTRLQSSMDLD